MTALVFLLLIFMLIVLILKKSKGQSNRSGFAGQSVQSKGEVAENDIVFCLERQIDAGLCGMIMQNLYIPKGERETTEIDVLFICSKGLFVIESKNLAGYIFGNDQERYWTVSLYAGRDSYGQKQTEKHQFYNPVWQNRMHIKHLNRLFDGYVPLYSLVVFSDRGTFSNLSCYSDDVVILQYSALERYFTKVRDTWLDQLSEERIQQIYTRLLPYTQVSEQIRQEHLEHILKVKNNPETCPWCGGQLVVRTAKRGASAGNQFYGCSNYPKCKYTRNV